MPFRGGPPPDQFGQLGGIGGAQSPQVPGLLQMAQAAMDGGGGRGGGLQAFGGDPRDTAQVGAPPRYHPGTTQGGYNAIFDPQAPSNTGGWFTMKDYLGQAPTAMQAAMNPGSMQASQQSPDAAGNNLPSTNNWRLLGNDPDVFMINGVTVNRRKMSEELHPKSVLGLEGGGPQGIYYAGGGQWKRPTGSYAWQQGYVGSDPTNWAHTSTPTY